jgi:hypothetical protein
VEELARARARAKRLAGKAGSTYRKALPPIPERGTLLKFSQARDGTASGRLSDSAAGERLDGRAFDSNGMVNTPAYAWLSDYEYG